MITRTGLMIVEKIGNPFKWDTREEHIKYASESMSDFTYTYSCVIQHQISDEDLERIKNIQVESFGYINVLCKIDDKKIISYMFNFNDEVIDILKKYEICDQDKKVANILCVDMLRSTNKYNGKYKDYVYFMDDLRDVNIIYYLLLVLDREKLDYLSSLINDVAKIDIEFVNQYVNIQNSKFLNELKEFINNSDWRDSIDKFLIGQYTILEE